MKTRAVKVNVQEGPKYCGDRFEFVVGLARFWKPSGNQASRRVNTVFRNYNKSGCRTISAVCPRGPAKIIPPKYLPKSWNWAIRSAIDRLKMEVGLQSAES